MKVSFIGRRLVTLYLIADARAAETGI